jgi:hypothetical protein
LLLPGEQVVAQAPHPMRVSGREVATADLPVPAAASREFLGAEFARNPLAITPPQVRPRRHSSWAFDKTAGITQGRNVADYVFDRAFGAVGAAQ